MIERNEHPSNLAVRGASVREALEAERMLLLRHYGPGPHPGTGTEQTVHGGEGGGRASRGEAIDAGRDALKMDREERMGEKLKESKGKGGYVAPERRPLESYGEGLPKGYEHFGIDTEKWRRRYEDAGLMGQTFTNWEGKWVLVGNNHLGYPYFTKPGGKKEYDLGDYMADRVRQALADYEMNARLEASDVAREQEESFERTAEEGRRVWEEIHGKPYAERHYGPGPHPSGSEQTVHNPHGGFSHETAPKKGDTAEERKQKLERMRFGGRQGGGGGLSGGGAGSADISSYPQETLDEMERIKNYYAFDLESWELKPVAVYSATHKELVGALQTKYGLSLEESRQRATEALAKVQPELTEAVKKTVEMWNHWQENYGKAMAQAEAAGWQSYTWSPYTGEAWPDKDASAVLAEAAKDKPAEGEERKSAVAFRAHPDHLTYRGLSVKDAVARRDLIQRTHWEGKPR